MKPQTKKTLYILGIVLTFVLIAAAILLFVPENVGFFRLSQPSVGWSK